MSDQLINEALAAFRYIVTNLQVALNLLQHAPEADDEIEKSIQVAQAAITVLEKGAEDAGKA